MTKSTGPACGNNPNHPMSDGDRQAVAEALETGPVRCPLCPGPMTLHTPSGARAHFTTVHPEQAITGREAGPWPMLVAPEPTDHTALRDRIATAIREFPFHNFGLDDLAYLLDSSPDTQEWVPKLAAAVLAVLPSAADRAAVLQEGAEAIAAHPGPWWDTRDRDAAAELLRRLAADEQPGARHVHITIHHPDPTTATTAALCIADLIRGEYSASHRLTITTDAQDPGAAPSRQADETPDTTTARGCPPDCSCRAVCIGTLKPAAGARQDGAQQ